MITSVLGARVGVGVQGQWEQRRGSATAAACLFVLKTGTWYFPVSAPQPIPPLLLDFTFRAGGVKCAAVSGVVVPPPPLFLYPQEQLEKPVV